MALVNQADQEKNKPSVLRAWCLYDWANSVYALLITSTLFPVFYGKMAVNSTGGPLVHFFGMDIYNSALYAFAGSFSFLLAGLLSPILSAYSDVGGYRKRFLFFFCFLGSLSCAFLYFFSGENLELGMATFCLAALGFSCSLVFYNSFLPEIASEDRFETLSARGFALGYIGSVLLLVLVLSSMFIPGSKVDFLDLCRRGFVLTACWWLGFGLWSIRGLPSGEKKSIQWISITKIWNRLVQAKNQSQQVQGLSSFLIGFFFMNLGVQTIMYLAAIFGEEELKLPAEKLILTILILQLLAIAGSVGFAGLSLKIAPQRTLVFACFLWIGICVGAYFVSNEYQFYGVAGLVGLVMGGSQSLLRSTFSHYLPKEERGKSTFFGFYDVLEKFSLVFGTLVFGLTNQLTGSMRISALALAVFFVLGAFFLNRKSSIPALV